MGSGPSPPAACSLMSAPRFRDASGLGGLFGQKPTWWKWQLTFTRHAERRMTERGVTEVGARAMLRWAKVVRPSRVECRFVVETAHGGRSWEVVVEPDGQRECVVVVTMCATD